MQSELQANKDALPSQIQITRASKVPAELEAEMPEVTEERNKKGKAHYVISKSQQTETETSSFCIEVFLPQG